jgi:DnaJ-class molecular chaperone
VKKAYEILCDPEAKKALDDLHRVKKARTAKDATQDAKRRKMREGM